MVGKDEHTAATAATRWNPITGERYGHGSARPTNFSKRDNDDDDNYEDNSNDDCVQKKERGRGNIRWTIEERNAITRGMALYGKDYTKISTLVPKLSTLVPTRTENAIREYIRTHSLSDMTLGWTRWTVEERNAIIRGMALYGKDYTKISALVPTRTTNAIRKYIRNHLLSSIRCEEYKEPSDDDGNTSKATTKKAPAAKKTAEKTAAAKKKNSNNKSKKAKAPTAMTDNDDFMTNGNGSDTTTVAAAADAGAESQQQAAKISPRRTRKKGNTISQIINIKKEPNTEEEKDEYIHLQKLYFPKQTWTGESAELPASNMRLRQMVRPARIEAHPYVKRKLKFLEEQNRHGERYRLLKLLNKYETYPWKFGHLIPNDLIPKRSSSSNGDVQEIIQIDDDNNAGSVNEVIEINDEGDTDADIISSQLEVIKNKENGDDMAERNNKDKAKDDNNNKAKRIITEPISSKRTKPERPTDGNNHENETPQQQQQTTANKRQRLSKQLKLNENSSLSSVVGSSRSDSGRSAIKITSRENEFSHQTWWMVDLSNKSVISNRQGATALVARCQRQYGWDETKCRRVLKAYKQFLQLNQHFEDWDATILSPSGLVDNMWHQHRLDLNNYCHDMMLLCGHVIGYNPDGALDLAAKATRTKTTHDALRQHFGSEYDQEMWRDRSELRRREEEERTVQML